MSFNLQLSKSENIKAMFSAPKWLPVVYHQYSVPTIFQVVTPISFLKKVILLSFLG